MVEMLEVEEVIPKNYIIHTTCPSLMFHLGTIEMYSVTND